MRAVRAHLSARNSGVCVCGRSPRVRMLTRRALGPRVTRRSRAIHRPRSAICALPKRWWAMQRKSLAVATQLFFAALGEKTRRCP